MVKYNLSKLFLEGIGCAADVIIAKRLEPALGYIFYELNAIASGIIS